MAPQVGFEPTTLRLTAECSTAELLRNIRAALTAKNRSFIIIESGSYLLSRAVTSQVPSAQEGLTTVFEMRTGGSLPP